MPEPQQQTIEQANTNYAQEHQRLIIKATKGLSSAIINKTQQDSGTNHSMKAKTFILSSARTKKCKTCIKSLPNLSRICARKLKAKAKGPTRKPEDTITKQALAYWGLTRDRPSAKIPSNFGWFREHFSSKRLCQPLNCHKSPGLRHRPSGAKPSAWWRGSKLQAHTNFFARWCNRQNKQHR